MLTMNKEETIFFSTEKSIIKPYQSSPKFLKLTTTKKWYIYIISKISFCYNLNINIQIKWNKNKQNFSMICADSDLENTLSISIQG